MSPTFFVIPGFKQQVSDPNFAWLVAELQGRGFDVKAASIHWDRRVMSDYINEFKTFYRANAGQTNYVLGFSYGAVVALSSAAKLRPDALFLCSLSPDFAEDQAAMTPYMKRYVGIHRLQDSSTRFATKIAPTVTMPAFIFCGAKEGKQYPQLTIRCQEAAAQTRQGSFISVPEAPHQIDHPNYQIAIRRQLDKLNP